MQTPINLKQSVGMNIEPLFCAAHLADVLCPLLVMLGREGVNLQGGSAVSPFDFVFSSFTRRLVASYLWVGAVYVIFRFIPTESVSRLSACSSL